MPTRVTPEQVTAVMAAAASNLQTKGEYGTPSIVKMTGVPRRTVRDILQHLGPELNQLTQSRHDEMLAVWHDTFFQAYDQMQTGVTARDRQALAITMGISTDKVQLLQGQPTALVLNLHEVRVEIPELAAKLTDVAKVLEAERG